jgi:hypothetical protein
MRLGKALFANKYKTDHQTGDGVSHASSLVLG